MKTQVTDQFGENPRIDEKLRDAYAMRDIHRKGDKEDTSAVKTVVSYPINRVGKQR